jgi:hypothetical protein
MIEGFSYESNCKPEYIYRDEVGKLDRMKNFMLRDIRTNFWLIIDGGIGKFIPARFGVPFALSENPNEFLPLRMANDPNYYLLSDYDGQGIRAVSNPYTKFFKLEVLIYNQRNILAYEDEGEVQYYLYVDDAGEVVSTENPDRASQFEMLMVQ